MNSGVGLGVYRLMRRGVVDVDAEYAAGLPRKRVVAGVVFRAGDGRVLLVEPSYKPNWEIPGGAVEADESPWDGAVRELREELGWERAVGRLLVVDHVHAYDGRPEAIVFVFDGGVLSEAEVEELEFPDGEIVSAGFYDPAETRHLVKPLLADRVEAALAAAREGSVWFCEGGKAVRTG
ncbi:NUDIX domain-containing protein [Kribbella sp. CA-245084]|uniref:NUDIX domain-containing protein n=1 Tax=Kribbella sp. CA-245084 TaxID=3239940 RepID=UPI003D8EA5F7